MWNVESMKAICDLERKTISHYPYLTLPHCPFMSVPRVLLEMASKDSLAVDACDHLTSSDLDQALNVMKPCFDFYQKDRETMKKCCDGASPSSCMDIPPQCLATGSGACVSFQLLFYLLDKDFDPSRPHLKYAVSASAASGADTLTEMSSFSRRELIPGKAENALVRTATAYRAELYEEVFERSIFNDMLQFIIASVTIVLVIFLYTQSIILTVCTLLEVSMTMVVAFFIYRVCCGLQFFPFLNVLAIPLLVGIGADDVFILNDLWNQEKENEERQNETEAAGQTSDLSHVRQRLGMRLVMKRTLKHAGVSIFVTSLTTGCSFLVNIISGLTIIKCFSVFVGICLFVNFFLMLLFIPAILVLIDRVSRLTFVRLCGEAKCCVWAKKFSKSFNARFVETLIFLTTKGRFLWLILLTALMIAGALLTLWKPRLGLPSSETQIFRNRHPFEKFRAFYQDQFAVFDSLGDRQEAVMPVYVYYGLERKDNGNYFDPDDRGTCDVADIDLLSPASQKWMRQFCLDLQSQSFIHDYIKSSKKCVFDDILQISKQNCNTTTQKCCGNIHADYMDNFDVCLREFWSGVLHHHKKFYIDQPMYPKDNQSAPPMAFRFLAFSNYTYSHDFESMDAFFEVIDNYFSVRLKDQPAWYYSAFGFFSLQKSISEGVYYALGLAVVVASLVLLFSTLDVLILITSALTIGAIVVVTVGVLVLLEWELNVLESMTITLAVGLSIDFVIHLGVAFQFCSNEWAWDQRMAHVLRRVGTAVTMASLTTFLAGLSIVEVDVESFLKLGIFLMLVMFVSWLYAMFFFLPLLASIKQAVNAFWKWFRDPPDVQTDRKDAIDHTPARGWMDGSNSKMRNNSEVAPVNASRRQSIAEFKPDLTDDWSDGV